MDMNEVLTLADVEKFAKLSLPEKIFNFLDGGSHNEQTLKHNLASFKKYKIVPRVLKNVENRDAYTTILGHKIGIPIGVAPSGVQKLCHADGEIATAKACVDKSTVMTISMWSNVSTAEVMRACPSLICFQQLYITEPRDLTLKFVRRAEENNVKALVLTVDRAQYPIRLREAKDKFDLQARLNEFKSSEYDSDISKILSNPGTSLKDIMYHGKTTWKDVQWLKSVTRLPVVLKGILSAEDAKEAVEFGADAIWVSNHGGRALDSVPATIDVLSEIIQAVDGKCEVYIDSGFRTGLDAFKAIALGARAVFIGRPVPYGLTMGGEIGVKKVFDILHKELDNTMALAGCKTISDISASHVKYAWKESQL